MSLFINNRFKIEENANKITDTVSGNATKIEPRLMQLLQLLIENQGATVTREHIAEVVWDNYPGAGEGMNQAVSSLRKLLADSDKQLIQTLPKKGYCLYAQLSRSEPNHIVRPKKAKSSSALIAGASILLIAVLVYVVLFDRKPEAQQKAKVKGDGQLNVEVKTSFDSEGKVNVDVKQDSASQAEKLKKP